MPFFFKPLPPASLDITKAKLVRYERGEIAHIENVLATETRTRDHRKLQQTETTQTVETSSEEEERKDLQSTEKFELEREIEKMSQSREQLEAGASVAGGFGPVSISAYVRGGVFSSSEERSRSATKFARELTEKASSRMIRKSRTERMTRRLEEIEEKNLHTFTNTDGDNIAGIYYWLDKYYRMKVFSYGKRLFYEFSVPEPAAFYKYRMQKNPGNDLAPPPPMVDPFTGYPLTPELIRWENYRFLAGLYTSGSVAPPPKTGVIVSKSFAREFPKTAGRDWSFSDKIEIPQGYHAVAGRASMSALPEEDSYRTVPSWERNFHIQVGVSTGPLSRVPGFGNTALAFTGETGVVPISGVGEGEGRFSPRITGLALNISIFCDRDTELYEKWQIETFSAIRDGYNRQLMNYRDAQANTAISQSQPPGVSDRNRNRNAILEELKKGVLMTWWGSKLDYDDGIEHRPDAPTPEDYPEFVTGIGAYFDNITQVEDAFDWENMSYKFYPYYYGRKDHWLERSSFQSDDTEFDDFLAAGSAKVRVPVRLDYSHAMLFFQMTGVWWPKNTGVPVPALTGIGHPDATRYNEYLSILEEDDDIDILTEHEVPIDESDPDTWSVKVPTSLVWLDDGNDLPNYES